jgi:hypothetical protein
MFFYQNFNKILLILLRLNQIIDYLNFINNKYFVVKTTTLLMGINLLFRAQYNL